MVEVDFVIPLTFWRAMGAEEKTSESTEDSSHVPGIIARREAEEALRQTEDLYRGLFEETRDGIVIVERDGRIIDANPACCDLLGYSREQLLAVNARQLWWDPADREAFQKQIELNGFVREFEQRMRRKDGSELYCLVTNSVRRSPQGAILGYQGILRDITDRKRLERELHTYQEQLRSLSAQITLAEDRERRRIAEELHDQVAQTLAVAQLRIESLRDMQSVEDQSSVLDELSDLVEHLDHDVRVLSFELSPPVLFELGLCPAVKWLAERLKEEHGLRVEVAEDGDGVVSDDVAALLFRCIRELLLNVVKHAQATTASVLIQRLDSSIRIEVADDGRGFNLSESGLDEAGRRFGLFSIRERLDYFGGRFEIESVPGNGTQCVLVSPLSLPEGESSQP